MNTIAILTVRNIKVFLRDRAAVFFSLLSMFIIIGLYVVFLGDTNVNSIKSAFGDVPGIRFLVDSWIMAGIIIVNSITVSLGVYGVMIEDESKKRIGGFLVAPINRAKLVAGYLFASMAVGFVLCLLGIVLAEAYIVVAGGELLSALSLLKAIGLTALSVFTSSSIVFLLISFVRTTSGFATLSTILGTVVGFLTGIYIPIGVLPPAVQSVIKFVPQSHAAALMRQIFMAEPMAKVFAGAPAEKIADYKQVFGVTLKWGSNEINATTMLLILAVSGVVFLLLSIYRMSKRKLG